MKNLISDVKLVIWAVTVSVMMGLLLFGSIAIAVLVFYWAQSIF
jgi:hypothetical protein